MPLSYHDGHVYVWRDGKPRVTETLFAVAYSGGRSTGLYGAGVYAYTSLGTLLSYPSKSMYAINVSNVKFFMPYNLDHLIDFASKLLACFNSKLGRGGIDKKYDDLRWEAFNLGRKISLNDKIYFSTDTIDAAVNKTIESYEKFGWESATQPINAILTSKGYMGVEPDFRSANSNEFGVVIFKEFYERKIGRNLGVENIDFGFEVKRDDEFVKKCIEDEMVNEIVRYYKEVPYTTTYMFKDSIKNSIYFEISRIVKQKKGKDYIDNDDYLNYYESVIWDEEFVKSAVDKALKSCIEKNDEMTCERVKEKEAARYLDPFK